MSTIAVATDAPLDLLGVVELVAAGHAAGVEVRDVLAVVADGADHDRLP